MKQEDKDLLLRYLSMALPYGVKFTLGENNLYTIKGVDLIVTDEGDWEYAITAKGIEVIEINYVKPYLRPMSSMTEEELEELNCLCYHNISVQDDMLCGYICGIEITDVQKFLLRYHFDFMGLIPEGLAIEVTEENNPYKD